MEVTYSQDLIIRDLRTLAALSVFSKKVYLPYHGVARDLQYAFRTAGAPEEERINELLLHDKTEQIIEEWKADHDLLLSEGVVEFLPVHRFKEHRHRHLDDTASKEFEIYGDTKAHGLTAALALRFHLIRDDLPGTEFFEGDRSAGQVKLAKSVFFIELPTFSARDDELLELREAAQARGIGDFWKMIDVQASCADDTDENYVKRAEAIRKEYTEWWRDNLKFRGKSLAVTALVTLCFVNSVFTPITTLAAADWIGEVNRKWAERKSAKNRAFKFISRLDGKLRRVAT